MPKRQQNDVKTRLMHDLRNQIARLEGRLAEQNALHAPIDVKDQDDLISRGFFHFGIESVDRTFSENALPLHALHEIRAATRAASMATGFIMGLLSHLAAHGVHGPLLWIKSHQSRRETGCPYGPGIIQFGFDPSRLILVHTRKDQDALWAAEEALSLSGNLTVILDVRSNAKNLTLTNTRRLHLRAENTKTPVFMLLSGSDPPRESVALTRWEVSPAPSVPFDDFTKGIGHPAFTARLVRNRCGQTGSFNLIWNHHDQRFEENSIQKQQADTPHSGALVSHPFNRSSGAA